MPKIITSNTTSSGSNKDYVQLNADWNSTDGVTEILNKPTIPNLTGLTATVTELNHTDGVTSNIQTQLNSKSPTANPTFTGTVSGITKAMVGLGNVDNTSDSSKNVLSATKLTTSRTINGVGFDGTTNINVVDSTKEPAFTKNTAFNKNFGSTIGTVTQGDDARLSNARPPTAHTHVKANVTDFAHAHLIADLPSYPTLVSLGAEASFTKNTAFNKPFGTTVGTVTEGNDVRLSDARTPLAHSHLIADLPPYPTTLPANGGTATTLTGLTSTIAELNYVDGVTSNVQTQLNSKVDNSQVLTNVPAGAVFTDTVYVHPSTHSADMIIDGVTNKAYTATEKTKLLGIESGSQVNTVTSVATRTGAVVLTKSDVGLSNVDNTTDLLKPISTATQTALNGKVDDNQVLTNVPLNAVFTDTVYVHPSTHSADMIVDGTTNKVFTATEKTKLGGISTGATANATDANLRDRSTHTGTQLSSTISNFASTVIGSVLTGLSTATNAVITTSDTVLSSLGKLQKQITDHIADSVKHITVTERTNWGTAYTNTHAHSNKTVLDNTTASFLTVDESKLDGISNGANKVQDSATNGNVLIDAIETNVYTHPVGTNPHGTTKADVGLGSVDNTADSAKPVSTAQQTALNLKANLVSPTFTGTPTAPTALADTNTTQIATTAFVQSAMSGAGLGDMLKSVYDSDGDGKVNSAVNADTVNNLTVLTAVPSGALFTDTIYTHPDNHPASMITGLPTSLPADGGNATTSKNLIGDDTRAIDSPPSEYMSGGTRYVNKAGWQTEFKNLSTMGLTSFFTGTYCYVETKNPWSDPSGGYPIQIAYGSGYPCWRVGTSTSAWSAWSRYNEKSTSVSATLLSTGWTGTSAPYSITVAVTGATATNNLELISTTTITAVQVKAMAQAQIVTGTQTTNSITLKAFGKKPTVDLPVIVIIRGD